jgi:hypothetical protein
VHACARPCTELGICKFCAVFNFSVWITNEFAVKHQIWLVFTWLLHLWCDSFSGFAHSLSNSGPTKIDVQIVHHRDSYHSGMFGAFFFTTLLSDDVHRKMLMKSFGAIKKLGVFTRLVLCVAF